VITFTREFHDILRREWPAHVEVYDESLDFDRFGDRANWPHVATAIAAKYRDRRIDAIVTEGSAGLQFAVQHLQKIFPAVPIVFGNAFEPIVDFSTLPPNVTGSQMMVSFAETFALARRLQPDAKRLVIVAGAATMDSALRAYAIRDVTPVLGGMQLDVLTDWSYPSLLQQLRELPPESIVILASFRKDWLGQSFNSGDLVPSITKASAAPVYGIARNWVGDGVVGGSTVNFAQEGARTSRLLVRVLQRTPGQPLPKQEPLTRETVVDWRQLQRWELPEDSLPAGTKVLFRAPSLWERYRNAVLLVLIVTVAQSTLIALLAIERRKRVIAQRALQEQATYEQMLAALRTDAVLHAPDDAPRALEHALARIGRYSGASSAELLVHGEIADRPSSVIRWAREDATPLSLTPVGSAATVAVEIPLHFEAATVGTLKLERVPARLAATTASRERLEAATNLLAGALARARAARLLAESRAHVEHIARVATMGQLGAAVSHELRQPLGAILANAEAGARLLEQDPPDVDEAREVFRDILHAHNHAMDVMEHVRLMFRRHARSNAPVSLNDVCRSAAKLVQHEAERREVIVAYTLADVLPNIAGDAVQLQQVALNLLMNAIESASSSPRERRVIVCTTERAGRAELVVSDSGAGIPSHVKQHMFESFFSTKSSGLGMGLSIVRQIVEQHGGEVTAQDMAGGGAQFRVTFPVASAVGLEIAGVA